MLTFLLSVCFQKRRTLRQTLQKQREEQMRAAGLTPPTTTSATTNASPLQNKHQDATATDNGNNMPTPPYRRPSLIEATGGSNAIGPSSLFPSPPTRPSPTRYGPPGARGGGSPQFTGGVRSGRTVTWHNPAHNPDFSAI